MADLDPLKFKVAIQDEATKELERIEKEFLKLNDKTITVKVEGLDDLKHLLSALQHTQVQNIGKEVSVGIRSATEGLQESAQKAIRDSLGQLATDLTAVKTAIQNDNFTAFSQRIEKCAEAVNTLDAAFKQFHVTIGQDDGLKNFMTGLGEVVRNVRTTMGQLNSLGLTNVSIGKKGDNTYENMRKAGRAVSDLAAKFDKLEIARVRANAVKAKIDTSAYDRAIERMERYQRVLEYISNTGGHDPNRITGSVGYRNATNDLSVQTTLLKRLTVESHAASGATSLLTSEEQRLAVAMNQGTQAARNQSQVLNDLKSMAMQYLSVWGAQQFVHNIIETGGLLEQQRLSIGAILGDMEQATTLFGQIKSLALKSPFGVVELDRMSKQLTAYGFEYKELYDWTKRLADISAATGTEVSRLSLALGHVRSEGALSGYTLRQFAMANVPVLRMLSENLAITTKEVRERVRKKEISYDDVTKVLKQLTDEGGMFYQAQETMSQALNAKFKNLRDAFDIMYGEIAEGGIGNALKKLAESLTTMAQNWERVGRAVIVAAGTLGVMRAATLLTNTALGASTVSALANVRATIQQNNAYLRLARAAGIVTQAEYEAGVSHEVYSVSGLKVALVTEKLTIDELQRAVALGKVKKGVAAAAASQVFNDAALINNVKVLGFWRKGWFLAGEAIRKVGTAIKSMLASLWPMLAISAVFEVFNRWSDQRSDAMEAAEAAAKATNRYSDLAAMSERLSSATGKSNEQLESGIKEMKSALTAVGAYNDELKAQVDNVDGLAEKYEILRRAIKDVSDEAEEKTNRKQSLLDKAMMVGNGSGWNPLNWFKDSMETDLKDVDKYTKKLYLALDKNDKLLRGYFEKAMRNRNLWKEEYAAKGASDLFMLLPTSEQTDLLKRISSKDDETAKAANEVLTALIGNFSFGKDFAHGSYLGAKAEIEKHRDEFSKYITDAFAIDYPEIDLSKANDEQKILFDKWLNKLISNLKDLGEAGKKAMHDVVIEGTIQVVPTYKIDTDSLENFLQQFEEDNPLGFFEWSKHGRSGVEREDALRRSAESYNRTFSGLSVGNIGSEAKKRIKELNEEETRLIAERTSAIYKENEAERDRVENRLKEIDETRKRLLAAQKDTNQYGEPDKNKADKNAKELRERVRILREAEESYQYWRKQVGSIGAEAHVNEEFGKILGELGYGFDNIEAYRTTLEELRAEYEKKPQSKEMLEALKELDKLLADIGRKDFEKLSEEAMSGMKKQLDDLTRAWEIYNSVLESSGDAALATRVSGVSYGATAADLKRTALSNYAGVGIDFDAVFGMSDEEIERYVEGLGVAEEKIKAVQDGLKEWKKAQQEVEKGDIVSYAQWLGTLVDYESQRVRLQNEYNDALELTNRLLKAGVITEEEARRRNFYAEVKRETEGKEDMNWYVNLYNNSQAMAREEFADAYALEMDNLDRQLAAGKIKLTEYAEKVENLNKIAQEFSTSGFLGVRGGVGAYLSGGVQGLIGYYQERANKSIADNGGVTVESKKWQELADGLAKTTKGAEQVTGAFSLIAEKANMLGDMFDALGMEDSANAFRDAGSVLGGIASGASSLSALGVWGMAAGAVIGGVTAVAKVHDERLERQIAQLDKDVQSIESNTELIKLLRSRQLGYDNGAMKWRMAASTLKSGGALAGGYEEFSKAQRAMYGYYIKNSVSSGYAQEYANLIAERQKEIEGLDKLLSKNKKDTSAIEEAKKKIAELDEQILYFGEDLAKELWGIDLKSWADQIGDALMNAFENGENAAKAYEDTVRSIMQNVTSEVLKVGILEPMMENLRERLFGKLDENGKRTGGVVSTDMMASNPAAAAKLMVTTLGEFFKPGGEGSNMVTAAQEVYTGINDLLKQMGYSSGLMNPDTSSTLSASVRGMSEETSDLLAGYVNALRQDVAADRLLFSQFVSQLWPEYVESFARNATAVANIDNNVRAIMEMMESGRGRMYEEIEAVGLRLDRVIDGFDSFAIRQR